MTMMLRVLYQRASRGVETNIMSADKRTRHPELDTDRGRIYAVRENEASRSSCHDHQPSRITLASSPQQRAAGRTVQYRTVQRDVPLACHHGLLPSRALLLPLMMRYRIVHLCLVATHQAVTRSPYAAATLERLASFVTARHHSHHGNINSVHQRLGPSEQYPWNS